MMSFCGQFYRCSSILGVYSMYDFPEVHLINVRALSVYTFDAGFI